MKRTIVVSLLLAILVTVPAGAKGTAGRHARATDSAWSQIAQLWHQVLELVGIEKDGTVPPPPPLKWPPSTTTDGGSCTDPNGCKPTP
jgi:hypothetical protein